MNNGIIFNIYSKEFIMVDFLKQVAYTGVGLASLTKDKIVELGKQAAEAGKMSEEEGKKFIDELQERAKVEKTKMDEKIVEQVNKTIAKLDLPTKQDIEAIKTQLDELKQTLTDSTKAE